MAAGEVRRRGAAGDRAEGDVDVGEEVTSRNAVSPTPLSIEAIRLSGVHHYLGSHA